MRTRLWTIVLLAASWLVVGCEQRPETTPSKGTSSQTHAPGARRAVSDKLLLAQPSRAVQDRYIVVLAEEKGLAASPEGTRKNITALAGAHGAQVRRTYTAQGVCWR